MRSVRPGSFKGREHEGRLNRSFADGEHARRDWKKFHFSLCFFLRDHQCSLLLLNIGVLNRSPFRKDLLDSFFQPVPRFQFRGLFVFFLFLLPNNEEKNPRFAVVCHRLRYSWGKEVGVDALSRAGYKLVGPNTSDI